jgi:DedD protein
MAFFKFRSSDPEAQAPAPAAEGLDLLRQRARHRLIGAAVLVVAGIVGFPMVFDSQPRPVALDLPIDILDKDKAKPQVIAPTVVAPADVVLNSASTTATPTPPASNVPPAELASDKAAELSTSQAVDKAVENIVEKRVDKALDKTPDTAQSKAQETVVSEDAKKSRALLEAAAAQGARFVVQAGAFAEAGAARDARSKLERAGMKTYTHIADTKDGKRTRVRVGPVATLAEADKLAERIRKLDLPAQVLAL